MILSVVLCCALALSEALPFVSPGRAGILHTLVASRHTAALPVSVPICSASTPDSDAPACRLNCHSSWVRVL